MRTKAPKEILDGITLTVAPCPGGHLAAVVGPAPEVHVVCVERCGWAGQVCQTTREAVMVWNAQFPLEEKRGQAR